MGITLLSALSNHMSGIENRWLIPAANAVFDFDLHNLQGLEFSAFGLNQLFKKRFVQIEDKKLTKDINNNKGWIDESTG